MPAAPPDSSDPAVHTLLLPSSLPISQPASRYCVPHTALPVPPAPLPSSADSAPADSHAGSTPRNSTPGPQIPPLPYPVSVLPAPQTTRVRTSPSDSPSPYRSTHRAVAVAPHRSVNSAPLYSPPAPRLPLPTSSPNVLTSALSSRYQTVECRKRSSVLVLRSGLLLTSADNGRSL